MTGISWTDEVWNPTTGCDKISPGCGLPRFDGDQTGGCYALAMAKRLKGMGQAKYQADGDPRTSGPGFGLTVHESALDVPFRWRKPRRIFVNSMSDLFHARVPENFVGGVWNTMALADRHTYQILTKRPERMRRTLSKWANAGWYWRKQDMVWCGPIPGPLPCAWLGTSIELDEYARRADDLRETPAAVRFLSLEPLLGPLPSLDLTGIDWCILGGESGADYRPMDIAWLEQVVTRCRQLGIPVWVKQDSGPKPGQQGRIPDDLWLHEFPETVTAGAA